MILIHITEILHGSVNELSDEFGALLAVFLGN